MFSVTNILCGAEAGNESLRYGHVPAGQQSSDKAPRPVVVWAVTRACNLKCVHCYAGADSTAAPDELTTDEGKRLLDDLAAYSVPAVLFSGGEPLVRPDLLQLIAHARSLSLPSTLSTNGLLIDEAMADRLAVSGLRYVGISIDGRQAQHDKLRGQPGAFCGTMAAVDRCKKRGMRVGLRFTVHALNAGELDAVFDLALQHNVDRLCIYHLAYAGRGKSMQRVDLTRAKTRAVVNRIFERTTQIADAGRSLEVLTVGNHADGAYALMHLEEHDPQRLEWARRRLAGTGGNQSGSFIASIDPSGKVHYDQFSWHYTCGDVRQQPFSQIWGRPTDPRLLQLRNRVATLPARCQDCRYLNVCNGNLRTRAEAATGDWMGADPSCYLTTEQIARQRVERLDEYFTRSGVPFTD